MDSVLFSSRKMDWETPQKLFNDLNKKYNFTLDAAASDDNKKCQHWFTEKDNGLLKDWSGYTVWCNPPYGRNVNKWVQKAAYEAENGVEICMLLASRTDTNWFHRYIYHNPRCRIEFLEGRMRFEINGNPGGRATFGSMLVFFNN